MQRKKAFDLKYDVEKEQASVEFGAHNFEDQEHWGEQLFQFKSPKLFQCDFVEQTVFAVQGIPDYLSVSHLSYFFFALFYFAR